MNADCKGALAQLNQSYKAFVHNGNSMSKQAVKKVLEYAISKGYDHTGLLSDAEIDTVLTPGTTIEQWERYYEDLKAHEARVERDKPREPQWHDYKNVTPMNEHIYEQNFRNKMDDYKKALSEWEMMRSCDAPNKPGYYRANND